MADWTWWVIWGVVVAAWLLLLLFAVLPVAIKAHKAQIEINELRAQIEPLANDLTKVQSRVADLQELIGRVKR